jgi:hypothetical protein
MYGTYEVLQVLQVHQVHLEVGIQAGVRNRLQIRISKSSREEMNNEQKSKNLQGGGPPRPGNPGGGAPGNPPGGGKPPNPPGGAGPPTPAAGPPSPTGRPRPAGLLIPRPAERVAGALATPSPGPLGPSRADGSAGGGPSTEQDTT